MKYWRLHAHPAGYAPQLALPPGLIQRQRSPQIDDRLVVASYDPETRQGHISHLGIISDRAAEVVVVAWRAWSRTIEVDTQLGHRYWLQPDGFAFATRKVASYRLPAMFESALGSA